MQKARPHKPGKGGRYTQTVVSARGGEGASPRESERQPEGRRYVSEGHL
jgi:hypothetical protein